MHFYVEQAENYIRFELKKKKVTNALILHFASHIFILLTKQFSI